MPPATNRMGPDAHDQTVRLQWTGMSVSELTRALHDNGFITSKTPAVNRQFLEDKRGPDGSLYVQLSHGQVKYLRSAVDRIPSITLSVEDRQSNGGVRQHANAQQPQHHQQPRPSGVVHTVPVKFEFDGTLQALIDEAQRHEWKFHHSLTDALGSRGVFLMRLTPNALTACRSKLRQTRVTITQLDEDAANDLCATLSPAQQKAPLTVSPPQAGAALWQHSGYPQSATTPTPHGAASASAPSSSAGYPSPHTMPPSPYAHQPPSPYGHPHQLNPNSPQPGYQPPSPYAHNSHQPVAAQTPPSQSPPAGSLSGAASGASSAGGPPTATGAPYQNGVQNVNTQQNHHPQTPTGASGSQGVGYHHVDAAPPAHHTTSLHANGYSTGSVSVHSAGGVGHHQQQHGQHQHASPQQGAGGYTGHYHNPYQHPNGPPLPPSPHSAQQHTQYTPVPPPHSAHSGAHQQHGGVGYSHYTQHAPQSPTQSGYHHTSPHHPYVQHQVPQQAGGGYFTPPSPAAPLPPAYPHTTPLSSHHGHGYHNNTQPQHNHMAAANHQSHAHSYQQPTPVQQHSPYSYSSPASSSAPCINCWPSQKGRFKYAPPGSDHCRGCALRNLQVEVCVSCDEERVRQGGTTCETCYQKNSSAP